ncbi:hypothetical protein [Magnetospirillum sp. UT-4]|uniref:hypothetical protein n=1 Tax=Magnetospirillum sp. UT-4 TaxID=2681467 RepID=UPI0015744A8D|nr:hypothetical protein [Magnetospirillum sp. UT-4]
MAFIIGVAVVLGVAEVALRLFSPFPIFEKSGHTLAHPVLLKTVDPSFPEIDRDGFRNPDPPARPELVTLGDSMTYGYNVGSAQSWPQQLGRMAGVSVYNFGIGGYGPLHYSWLLDKALEKKPRVVLLGIHLPNDLNDVCKMFGIVYWKDWADRRGIDVEACVRRAGGVTTAPNVEVQGPTLGQRLKLAVRRTALGSAVGTLVVDPLNYALSRKAEPGTVVFRDGRNDTYISKAFNVFTAGNSDPAAEWMQIAAPLTEALFVEMAGRARTQGVDFGIVFIPSKQSVFQTYLEEAGQTLPPEFLTVVEQEAALEGRFAKVLDGAGIAWANARPALVSLLREQREVYPFRDDDHPLAPGYEAIARVAFERFFARTEGR